MRETTFDVPTDVAHLLIVLENWYNEACRNQKRFGEPPFEKVMVWRSAEKGINYTLAPGARRLGFDFHGVPQDHRFSYRDLVHVDAYELSGQLTRLTLRGKYGFEDACVELAEYIKREFGIVSTAVTNVSGGVTLNGEQIEIGGDAVGRDKNIYIGSNASVTFVTGKPLNNPPSVPDGQEQESEGKEKRV